MTAGYRIVALAAVICTMLASGCMNDTTELKQKIVELERKLEKQQRDLGEFAGKFSPPKDFSADIQRLEDQQDRISQMLKSKVDPINMKLEEFRDWAQESVKQRGKMTDTLKRLEKTITVLHKTLEGQDRTLGRLTRALGSYKKKIVANSKSIDRLNKNLLQLRREVLDNNTKLVTALKKTLPKVKRAAVAEVAKRIAVLERELKTLKGDTEARLKRIDATKQFPRVDYGAAMRALKKKIADLEEIVAAQKSSLLEIGSKLHTLESSLGGR